MLEIENLHKDFGGFKVLKGITLRIEENERHAIIGPNGSGKSTLFNVITGKYAPSNGKILFKGEDITGLSPFKISRKRLGRSFQIINFFQEMTVYESIRSAMLAKRRIFYNVHSRLARMKRVEEECLELIRTIGLLEQKDILASELSYGDQRALEIGITLAAEPKIILLDEPTAGMSRDETRRAIEFIKRVTTGRTLLIVEHDMEVVFALADRITVLNSGGILVTDIPEKIRANERVREIYLGEEDGFSDLGG